MKSTIRAYLKRNFQSWVPYLVLIISLSLMSVVTHYVLRMAKAKDEQRFESAARRMQETIKVRLETYIALLHSAAAFFSASDAVSADQFKLFVDRLDLPRHYPGVSGIAFVPRIRSLDRDMLESKMRRQGHSSFKIWPERTARDYYPVVYLEPVSYANRILLGYDMSSSDVRWKTMQQARDVGTPAASPKLRLIQNVEDPVNHTGFIIYVPVYMAGNIPSTLEERRSQLLGFVCSPIRIGELFQGLFGSELNPKIDFQLFDGNVEGAAGLMYDSHHLDASPNHFQPKYVHASVIDVAGYPWRLVFSERLEIDRLRATDIIIFAFLGGVFMSIVLFAVSLSQVKARRAAERNAAQLQQSEEALRKERQVAEDRERYYRMQSEAIPQIVWTAYPDGWIDYYNQRWYDYAMLTVEETQSGKWRSIVHPDDLDLCIKRWRQALQTGSTFEVECRFKRASDGTYRWHLGRALPLKDKEGKIKRWFGTCTDIDDQKRAQERILEANEELKRLSEMKSEFTSMISHELRTPLSAIKEGIDLTLDEVEGTVTVGQHETLSIAKANVDRLARLINNVLDFSRIESGVLKINFEKNNINALITDVYKVMNFAAQKKDIHLQVNLPKADIVAECDADRLKQVLINLIDNSIKFTPNHGRIECSAAVTEDDFEIRVVDNGIGIRKEDQERIFELYQQSNLLKTTRGAGVGLAVCKKIIALHKGEIRLESEYGKGSCFVMVLPLSHRKA